MKKHRPRMSQNEYEAYKAWKRYKTEGKTQRRVMILPDLHAPFIMDGAFEFARGLHNRYDITEVACTGDTTDFHRSSFHRSETDAMSADQELDATIKQLKPWHDEFPNMKVANSNHDDIPIRKLKEAGLSSRIMRPFNEIIECPTWDFKTRHDFGHNTIMVHGMGRAAHTMAKEEGLNVIMGHKHSKTFVRTDYYKMYGSLFAMQLGAFLDEKSYAARYASNGVSTIPSVGFLFENDDSWIPFYKVYEKNN